MYNETMHYASFLSQSVSKRVLKKCDSAVEEKG